MRRNATPKLASPMPAVFYPDTFWTWSYPPSAPNINFPAYPKMCLILLRLPDSLTDTDSFQRLKFAPDVEKLVVNIWRSGGTDFNGSLHGTRKFLEQELHSHFLRSTKVPHPHVCC